MNIRILIAFLILTSCQSNTKEVREDNSNLASSEAKEDTSTNLELNLKEDNSEENDEIVHLLEEPEPLTDSVTTEPKKHRYQLNLDTIKSFECNVNVILYVSTNMDQLTKSDINALLKTFDESCSNNIEFSEFSNVTLFKTLQNYPAQTLQLLKSDEYDFAYIYKELSSSLHDLIPLKEVEKAIKESELKGNKVDSVYLALKVAAQE